MNYPLISEYIQAIKLSEENFDKLTNLRPVFDTDGNPVMSSGNFAVVFKMLDKQTGKFYAVKCFLREQEGREEGYKLIASELEYISSTFLTPIKYFEKELFVDTAQGNDTEFPVLLMDWVEGLTLDKYIRNNIHDQYKLALIAYQFCRMGSWLLSQEFAHGDLKPDNIIVREDGQLVLVDYDGMFVPAMRGQKSRELGSVDYRHPLRTEDVFNSSIDDFSIASIALSLKAISLKPELLNDFGADDRLLLSAKDYQNISESECLKAIQLLSNDVELAQLLGLFYIAYARNELSNVSFRLFNIAKPEFELTTIITEDDLRIQKMDNHGGAYANYKLILGPTITRSSEYYTIADGTKVICDGAFSMNQFLRYVKIPDTVVCLGNGSFSRCRQLNTIIIPNSIIKMEGNPFDCNFTNKIICKSSLFKVEDNVLYDRQKKRLISYFAKYKHFIVPNTVKVIGRCSFYCCESLQSIDIPVSVSSIEKGAFVYCRKLKTINLYGVVESFDPSCLFGSHIEVINIPKGAKGKYSFLFKGNKLERYISKLNEF
ncbi:leucine-rich repeat protein [Bacteroides sp.]|uniref:leucine-rich repeat protein n=1 Tax=Bacteroides sp. TaxID=29523 RepID=UPI0025C3B1CF|nr:leucine-rich repeat protein [Bacteroides sp.]